MSEALRYALSLVEQAGAWAPALFVVTYVAACVLMIPGLLLTLGAGAIFGLGPGFALVTAGANLGATAAFLTGRYLARDWVRRRLAGRPAFQAVDQAVGKEGFKMVLLLRLSPAFPFILINYALGLTSVPLSRFAAASLLGMLPATGLFVYLGALAGDVARLGAGSRRRLPAEWALLAVGLAATAAVVALTGRIAKKALAQAAGGSGASL